MYARMWEAVRHTNIFWPRDFLISPGKIRWLFLFLYFFFYSSSLTDYFIFYINSIFVYSYQRKDNEGGMICTVSVDLDGNPDIRMEQSCKLIILMLIYNKEEKKKDKGASSFVQSRLGWTGRLSLVQSWSHPLAVFLK